MLLYTARLLAHTAVFELYRAVLLAQGIEVFEAQKAILEALVTAALEPALLLVHTAKLLAQTDVLDP